MAGWLPPRYAAFLSWPRHQLSIIARKTLVKITLAVALGALAGSVVLLTAPEGARSQPPTDEARADAIAVAQASKEAPMERPEQKKTAHDLSDVFNPSNATPSSEALIHQQDRGQMLGFDFYRDPLGAMKPGRRLNLSRIHIPSSSVDRVQAAAP
jgi:hypothetical protein